jgi:hypothetical protein
MPVIYVRRGNPAVAPIDDSHAQTVGTLEFLSATTIALSATLFTTAGTYELFNYTTFSGGQSALNSFVTVTHPTRPVSNLLDDTANSRVLVTLG